MDNNNIDTQQIFGPELFNDNIVKKRDREESFIEDTLKDGLTPQLDKFQPEDMGSSNSKQAKLEDAKIYDISTSSLSPTQPSSAKPTSESENIPLFGKSFETESTTHASKVTTTRPLFQPTAFNPAPEVTELHGVKLNLKALRTVQLTYDHIIQLLPSLKSKSTELMNTLVKIYLGKSKSNSNKNLYVIGKILSVVETSESYEIKLNPRDNQTTNLYLGVEYGDKQYRIQLNSISNRPLRLKETLNWIEICQRVKVSLDVYKNIDPLQSQVTKLLNNPE